MGTETAPRRCLVTGGAGFVGRHLVRALLARGDRVVVFDRGGAPTGAGEEIAGDICDGEAVARAARGCDVVFHLASVVQVSGSGKEALSAINVGGTERVIEACRREGATRLVYCSSASVVFEGRDIKNGDEELPYARRTAPYAETKGIAEQRVLAASDGSLATCALRPHLIFGPGDTRMMPAMLRHAAGRARLIIGDPQKLSDFTYIDNLVDALILAAERLTVGPPPQDGAGRNRPSIAGRAYFITNGEPRSYWGFWNDILARLGRPTLHRRIPDPIARSAAWVNERIGRLRGDGTASTFTPFTVAYLSTHHYFSHARATRDLGYLPRISVDEGIARTVRALGEG
ncbi:MAG: NAD-dependent epimerase/dehydratase family protein [Myxococcales bacterium]|nr:NAD-dependent epimerase/dehydratase family protein [Myxococcales bacterium]